MILAYASEAAGPHIHIHSHHDLLCGRFPRSHRRRRMPNLVERPSQSMQVLTTAPRFPTGEISRRFPIRPWLPPPPSPTPPLPLAPWRCHSLSCSAAKGPDRCWQGSGWGGAHHCRGADEGGNQSSSSEPITAEDQMREAIRAHHQSSSSELIRAHQSSSEHITAADAADAARPTGTGAGPHNEPERDTFILLGFSAALLFLAVPSVYTVWRSS